MDLVIYSEIHVQKRRSVSESPMRQRSCGLGSALVAVPSTYSSRWLSRKSQLLSETKEIQAHWFIRKSAKLDSSALAARTESIDRMMRQQAESTVSQSKQLEQIEKTLEDNGKAGWLVLGYLRSASRTL
jgi:hypothetical protein